MSLLTFPNHYTGSLIITIERRREKKLKLTLRSKTIDCEYVNYFVQFSSIHGLLSEVLN